ncbi:MAG: phospholipid carrier-dependent glycosyltransferase, partial [Desulfurococcaceae archaeon]
PPAGKYVLCLEMLLLGDYPTYWRIGPIVAGLATLALTVLAVRELTGNDVVAFAAGALLLSDPMYRLLSSIAFLDIYVALFTSLAFYLVARGRRRAAWAAALAGTAFKFNALFALVPVWAAEVRGRARGSASPLIDAVDETARFILKSVAAFLAIQVAVSIPLIEHFGLASWINQSIVGAISWHTGVKCTNCGESAPWDWFLGARAFTPYIYGNGAVVAAMGFWPFWSLALALTILMLPAYKSSRDLRVSGGFTLGILAGFLILWLAGGRTQYSFYAVQLAPTVYAFLASAAYESFTSPDVFLGSLGAWRRALARAGKAAAEAAYWLLLG